MAIVEMKHLTLLAPKENQQALLSAMQRMGCVQLTMPEQSGGFENTVQPEQLQIVDDQMTRVHWAIGKVSRYSKVKAPMFGGKPTITTDEAQDILSNKLPVLMQTVEALETLEQQSGELRGENAKVLAQKEQLMPWQTLPVPLSSIKDSKHVAIMVGTARKEALDEWMASGNVSPLCNIEEISSERDVAYVCVMMHHEVATQMMAELSDVGFSPVHLPKIDQTVAQCIAECEKAQNDIANKEADIIKEIASHADQMQGLQMLYDCLASQREQWSATQDALSSKATFYMEGWVPAKVVPKLEERLQGISQSAYLVFRDPEEEEDPPVALSNSNVTSPFESIVSGFALPSYTGFDPTAIMMPFFINFMGMMISDAGYGLMMALFIPIIIMVMKPAPGTKRLMWVLTGGGVMTLVWGALYNTWFGFSPLPSLFDPVNNPMPVMAVCIALGAVHLFTGLGVGAYMNIKRGDFVGAIADQLSWFLLVVGLGLLLVMPSIGQWVAIAGVVIILVTSGREKSNNPIKRLLSGLGALYGATSWISDLLSYMRLFGMGLATGVIGMVINQLVGMVMGAGIIGIVLGAALFVGGHAFNAGINILGAYVHSCRLQYIEFFGKFYEDGGKPFAPLSTSNRYCYITEASKRS